MGELRIFKGDEVRVILLDLLFKCGGIVFATQFDGDDGGAFFMEELLRGAERHKDAAIFKSVGGFENPDDVKNAVADRHAAAHGGAQEIGRAGAEDHVIVMLLQRSTRSPASHVALRMRASLGVTPKQVMMGWSALETIPNNTGSA